MTKSIKTLKIVHIKKEILNKKKTKNQELYVLVGLMDKQFSSVTQSCPTLYDSMDCSTPGFPVHHHLLDFAQTHVHQVGDVIQPSHPQLPPSPPALNLSYLASGSFPMSQFFASGGQNIGTSASASVLPINIQG